MKTKLKLDKLQVESFVTTPALAGARQGTIYGYHLDIEDPPEPIRAEPTFPLTWCGPSCFGTCNCCSEGAESIQGCPTSVCTVGINETCDGCDPNQVP